MLAAANAEGLVIFWIPVVDSAWRETGIAQFQAAHEPSQPLDSLKSPQRAKAWVRIAKRVSESLVAAKAAAGD